MSDLTQMEWRWTKELQLEVEIYPRTWKKAPEDYVVYISGHYVTTCESLKNVEEYLQRYFLLQEGIK